MPLNYDVEKIKENLIDLIDADLLRPMRGRHGRHKLWRKTKMNVENENRPREDFICQHDYKPVTVPGLQPGTINSRAQVEVCTKCGRGHGHVQRG